MTDLQKDSAKSAKLCRESASEAANRIFNEEEIQLFNRVILGAETASFITRDSALQVEAKQALENFLESLAHKKADFVAAGDEEGANACLALECLVSALNCELDMWLRLKNTEPEAAWDSLVSAQLAARAAIRAHACGEIAELRLRIYDDIERVIFPPQVFSSVGIYIVKEDCSICSGAYDQCAHVKGRPYMGQFCFGIVREANLREVSIVPDPVDKRCRVTHFSDEGRFRNRMTWALEDRDSKALPSQHLRRDE